VTTFSPSASAFSGDVERERSRRNERDILHPRADEARRGFARPHMRLAVMGGARIGFGEVDELLDRRAASQVDADAVEINAPRGARELFPQIRNAAHADIFG
jgi:hypothetical protein